MSSDFLDRFFRTVFFHSPFRHFVLYKYRYAFTPAQYAKLVELAGEAAEWGGDFVEVGCYRGYTTTYLNRHLDDVGFSGRYLAVDTFGGFTKHSVAYEKSERGKFAGAERRFAGQFRGNSQRWFDATMRLNGISRVTSVRADAESLGDHLAPSLRCSFALIDVDLHRPTLEALRALSSRMSRPGVIIVDDCVWDQVYDGSAQALEEFCGEADLDFEVAEIKLGIVRLR